MATNEGERVRTLVQFWREVDAKDSANGSARWPELGIYRATWLEFADRWRAGDHSAARLSEIPMLELDATSVALVMGEGNAPQPPKQVGDGGLSSLWDAGRAIERGEWAEAARAVANPGQRADPRKVGSWLNVARVALASAVVLAGAALLGKIGRSKV